MSDDGTRSESRGRSEQASDRTPGTTGSRPHESRLERYESALSYIAAKLGGVCGGYEDCYHRACNDSYAAWATAAQALEAGLNLPPIIPSADAPAVEWCVEHGDRMTAAKMRCFKGLRHDSTPCRVIVGTLLLGTHAATDDIGKDEEARS